MLYPSRTEYQNAFYLEELKISSDKIYNLVLKSSQPADLMEIENLSNVVRLGCLECFPIFPYATNET